MEEAPRRARDGVLLEDIEEREEVARQHVIARTWRNAARRAKNKEKFDQMVRQNSQILYGNLVKELIVGRQKSLITDIPGFSYFLLLKYTLDPEEIETIMSDF